MILIIQRKPININRTRTLPTIHTTVHDMYDATRIHQEQCLNFILIKPFRYENYHIYNSNFFKNKIRKANCPFQVEKFPKANYFLDRPQLFHPANQIRHLNVLLKS
jgi:hypothetical protein